MGSHQPDSHGDGHGRGHGHEGAFDSERIIEQLEVEGQMSVGLLHEAVTLASHWFDPATPEPRRVIDLGCGPGVGTVALAEWFPTATIVGVDASQPMLDRAADRAARLGHGDRVETRQLDLDGDLAVLGHADLVVAAMSIHHVANEVATLRQVRSLLEPAGLVCILERDEAGRPGIETTRSHLPGVSNAERYPQMLTAAGFEVVEQRQLTAVGGAPDDAPAPRTSSAFHHGSDQVALRLARKLFIARPARGTATSR